MVVPSFDYLDSMMWSIVASGILLAIAALRLSYDPSTDSIDEKGKNVATGIGIALALSAFYLFITGLAVSFQWPFAFSGGIYNVLFGGVAALGGLVLISAAVALFLGRGLQASSYFALPVGLYLLVDAISIWTYSTDTVKITKEPLLSALLFAAPAVAMILSVPATHIKSKWSRRIFAVVALAFAMAWLYFAYTTTNSHLKPPAPA